MKGGPGKNKQHLEIAAGPVQGPAMPTPRPLPWNRTAKGERKLMNKGGSVKKRKGYKYGGTVDTPEVSVMPDQPITVPRLTETGLREIGQPVGYKHGGIIEHGGMVSGAGSRKSVINKAYKKARKKQPTGRLTDRDIGGSMVSSAYKRARKKQPTGRLTTGDLRRAGLK